MLSLFKKYRLPSAILLLLVPGLSNAEVLRSTSQHGAWAGSIDNDLFSPASSSDVDFTGGFAFTYAGEIRSDFHKILDMGLAKLDRLSIRSPANVQLHFTSSIELGLYGFTPNSVESYHLLEVDRPYASLMYVSSGRTYQNTSTGNSWSTSMSIGVLGLDLFGSLQNTIHQATGSESANGWHNQISDGGEITFRYQLAYMDYWQLAESIRGPRVKTTYFSSIGYLTEIGLGITTAYGLISNPSSRFSPELISYGERVNDIAMGTNGDRGGNFWAGAALKWRFYNAFLQGQFRESVYTSDRSQLEPLICEAWLGYTYAFKNNYTLSYVLRWQSAELKTNDDDRDLLWGGVVLGHSF